MRYVLFLALSILPSFSEASWHMDPPKGFNWYAEEVAQEEVEFEVKEEDTSKGVNTVADTKPSSPFSDAVDTFQKDLKEAKARAIISPTFENVAVLKTFQDKAVRQSTDFSKMWMLVNLMSKDEYPQDNPNNRFRKVQRIEQDKQLDADIKELAKTHGLFFFFKSACPYCHEFAPHVRSFANDYGFEVQAISKDGSQIDTFPNAVTDNGMGAQINPEGISPALFLANPSTGEIIPLAWGMVSPEELRQNIRIILTS